jgi:hypothetical protein
MKHKIAAALITVVVIAASVAAFAEKRASGGKVFLLKSGSKIIAELHVRPAAGVEVQCADSTGRSEYNMSTGTLVARGGAILKLIAGTNSITVRAEEIESVPEPK